MNSLELTNNLKYIGKIIAIFIVIYFILLLIINPYISLLLALVITVSILIIENLIHIINNTIDPLNCNQCKISTIEHDDNQYKEPFVSNTINTIIENISSTIKKSNNLPLLKSIDNDNDTYEFKCIRVNKVNKETQNQKNEINSVIEDFTNLNQINETKSVIEDFTNLNQLEYFIDEQKNKNLDLANKLKSTLTIQEPTIKENVKIQEEKLIPNHELNYSENKLNQPINSNNTVLINKSLQSPYLNKIGFLGKQEELESQIKNNQDNLNNSNTYDESYVNYQQNGLEKQESNISLDNKLFKLGIGQPNVSRQFLDDGKNYYKKLYSYSSSAPTPKEALTNELKYGDFNYISPLNKGMINSDYTFISPNNWYPVSPHPPVCVTNKNCTTLPIQITDGKDYMSYASLEDFDASRRFTGNMGINIDYVKNVLNNDNGY